MAKREISSTLKNLKFMQRAVLREEKVNEEKGNPEPEKSVFATATVTTARKRCVVIVEGDPHPGALRGRMSFQSFNPSIDKLNEEAVTNLQRQASNTSKENENIYDRSEESKGSSQENKSDPEFKRKQPVVEMEIPPTNKSRRIGTGVSNGKSSPQSPSNSNNEKKPEKLDWNLLRPPKAQKKRT